MLRKKSTVILVILLGFLLFIRLQHLREAEDKAYITAIAEAQCMGYLEENFFVYKEKYHENYMIVVFKDREEETVHALEIWMRFDNVYDITVLGAFKDVNPKEDRNEIARKILMGRVDEL